MEWFEPFWFSSAAALVFLIPGASLLVWLPEKRSREDPIAALADATALSISITAALALWLMILGIKAGAPALIFFYSAGILLAIAGLIVRRSRGTRLRASAAKFLPWILAAALIAILAAWRFYQSRDLVLPSWVDSVHHTLVVRKIIEYQGLPPDLSPYIPTAFFYHYGFHLLAALFAFWTRLPPADAVLWLGSVMNAAAALSVYRVALTAFSIGEKHHEPGEGNDLPIGSLSTPSHAPRFWNKPRLVALSAALLTGFAFQMPAYYVTWGRYTLLAGLVVLGPAVSAAWEAWRQPGDKGAAIRLAILMAGLCMTHYFALLLAGIFLVVFGGIGLFQAIRQPARLIPVLLICAWVGLGIFVASPWLWRVGLATRESVDVQVINPIAQDESAQQGSRDYLNYLVYLAGPRRNHILFIMAGLGLVAALRKAEMRPLAFWGILLCFFSLPWGMRLGPFRPDHFIIVLFFPASILLGNLLFEGTNTLSHLVQPGSLERAWFRPGMLSVLLAVLVIWGMRETQHVLNRSTLIADRYDRAALDWIQEHIPGFARFYTNGVLWQGTTYRGVDGGYWLTPYTGRFSLIPPALYVNAEPEYVEEINRWAKATGEISGCTVEFWNLVEEAQLSHVYLRRGAGKLQPASLDSCPGIRVVYHNEEVSVYQIVSRP